MIPPFPQQLGSAEVADYAVTDIANQVGLLTSWDRQTRYFKATLTKTLIDLEDRAQLGNQVYVNIRGEMVAENRAELYSGPHAAPILNQNGQVVTGSNVAIWAGSTADGQWDGNTCSNWSDPSGASGVAEVGNLNGVASGHFLDNGTRACNLGARLVGTGERQTPVILNFDNLTAGSQVGADINPLHASFATPGWTVATDTLGGHLTIPSGANYITLAQPTTTINVTASSPLLGDKPTLESLFQFDNPGVTAGGTGLAGLSVVAKGSGRQCRRLGNHPARSGRPIPLGIHDNTIDCAGRLRHGGVHKD